MNTPILIRDAEHLPVSKKVKVPRRIYLAGAISAFAAGLIFLAGVVGLAGSNNWLITILRLLAGSNAAQPSQLYRLSGLDLALLALIAIMHVGLYAALHRSHRILALLALVQPPLGILLFLLTHNAGRSAAMGAGLVISVAMLRGGPFSKWMGWIGLTSNALLFAGDLCTGLAPSTALAISTGLGYVLIIGWLLAVGHRLLHLARRIIEQRP